MSVEDERSRLLDEILKPGEKYFLMCRRKFWEKVPDVVLPTVDSGEIRLEQPQDFKWRTVHGSGVPTLYKNKNEVDQAKRDYSAEHSYLKVRTYMLNISEVSPRENIFKKLFQRNKK